MCVREREIPDPTISQLGWVPKCPANMLFFGNATLIESTKVSDRFSGPGATTPIKPDLAWAGRLTQTESIRAPLSQLNREQNCSN